MSNEPCVKLSGSEGPAALEESSTVGGLRLIPSCDVYEDKDGVVIELEVPGVMNEDLSVLVDRDRLVVEGVVPFEGGERGSWRYHRVFSLTSDIDVSGAMATLRDGVATVSLPKRPSPGSYQISVTLD